MTASRPNDDFAVIERVAIEMGRRLDDHEASDAIRIRLNHLRDQLVDMTARAAAVQARLAAVEAIARYGYLGDLHGAVVLSALTAPSPQEQELSE